MAEVQKTERGVVDKTDVKVGDTVTYIDGQCGLHFDAVVLNVSAEGRAVDLSHPDPKQPRRNAVQYSDDGVWHSWHFRPENAPAQPAPDGLVQENQLSPEYTHTVGYTAPFDPTALTEGSSVAT